MQVVVDGLLTNYAKSGNGKTVLLLHGWGDSIATFDKLSTKLGDNFQILAVDLPGFGGTQRPDADWGLDDYAKFVANWLTKIKASKVHAVIGHSNGGAIAINGIFSGVLEAEKLVLLASSGIRVPKKSLKTIARVGKTVTSPLPTSLQAKIRKRFYGSIDSEILLIPEMQETFKKIVSQDVLSEAAKITQPTLIVYGENDEATPSIYGAKFHEAIKNSELHVLKPGGHFIHIERDLEVNRLVSEFLSK